MFLPDPASCGPAVLTRLSAPKGLDPLEIDAATVGRADAGRFGWDASLTHSGLSLRLRGLFATLTGIEGVKALADERLEKLRLFACMMRRRDRRANALGEALLQLGYSPRALRQAVTIALA